MINKSGLVVAIFAAMIFKQNVLFILVLTILFVSKTSDTWSQKQEETKWMKTRQSLAFLKDDFYLGSGLNISGMYSSRFKNQTSNGVGFQFFTGAYVPFNNNIFLHGQLGISRLNFSHFPADSRVNLNLTFLEVPLFFSAQLPISNDFETRLLLGWQANLLLGKSVQGSYSQDWIENNSFYFNQSNLLRSDFGFYFGLAAEYKRFMFRASGFTGINNIIQSDTGMINTFKLDIAYFIFRK